MNTIYNCRASVLNGVVDVDHESFLRKTSQCVLYNDLIVREFQRRADNSRAHDEYARVSYRNYGGFYDS